MDLSLEGGKGGGESWVSLTASQQEKEIASCVSKVCFPMYHVIFIRFADFNI